MTTIRGLLTMAVCGALLAVLPCYAQTEGDTSQLRCDDLPFVYNVFWTTDLGPAAADVIANPSNMVPCTQGDYALCYYSGARGMPCEVDPEKGMANCVCEAFTASSTAPFFVDVNAILNTCVYIETVVACGLDGSGCSKPDSAPVCAYIAQGSLMPGADLVSTFSMQPVRDYERTCVDCEDGIYAGCMTAPCYRRETGDGGTNVICECPLFDGPFQYGRSGPYTCDAGDGLVWSAAYNPDGCKTQH